MIKQRQIAEKLGVSINTVSRALRNHPDLSDETKKRVRKTASDMGYGRMNPAPAHTSQSKRLGILFYREGHMNLLDSDIHRQIFLAIERECQKAQVETVFQLPTANNVPLCVKNRTVDGLLLFGRYSEASVPFVNDFPSMAISSYPSTSHIARITTDNSGGILALTEYLISQGHTRIIYIGPEEDFSSTQLFRDRYNGYLLAMTRHGLATELYTIGSIGTHYTFSKSTIPENATAVVCASDTVAIDFKHYLSEQQPNRLSKIDFTGFDNLPSTENEQITTYGPDWDSMGVLAAHFLIHRPEILTKNFNVMVPGEIYFRASTKTNERKS